MYRCMRPSFIETQMEYKISKHLIVCFVKSRSVLMASDNNSNLSGRIVNFIVNHVLVHDMQYLHYRRSHVRNFDAAHVSAHKVSLLLSVFIWCYPSFKYHNDEPSPFILLQGTNNGMKTHTASVKATMTLNNYAKILCLQSNLKACQF